VSGSEHVAAPEKVVPLGTPWSRKQNITRAFWMLFGRLMFRCTPRGWHGLRCTILRGFGARIARGVRIARTVDVEIPWTLDIGEGCDIGEHAILYGLGPITIGARTVVAPYAHLCAGTHDYTSRVFQLLKPPIVIGAECHIGTDAYVAPEVTIGDRVVLGARACAYKDLESGTVYTGNPAKAVGKR
jgi:putative colanic acid biosynthesis acetyltransferase WcaF